MPSFPRGFLKQFFDQTLGAQTLGAQASLPACSRVESPRGAGKDACAPRGLTARDVILFDGAERLNRFEWHRFKLRSKKAGGLIVTSHRKGLLPTLKECSTSPELLNGIIAELLNAESAAIRPANVELYRRHKGNLREALREMYDLYAG